MIEEEIKEKLRLNLYYILVGLLSVFLLVFAPMFSSTADLRFNFPNSPAGWFVFITSRLAIAGCNVLIFHLFMKQGKLNSKNHPNYIAAMEILNEKLTKKEFIPRSPKKFNREQYSRKGVIVFLTTIFSTLALANAIINYDISTLVTYTLVLLVGIVFGVMQMRVVEDYYTEELLIYAKYKQGELNDDNKCER